MPRAKTKQHEKQQLQKVEVIRGRVLRLMISHLANLRSFLSLIPGNEFAVERLRGKSGDSILARCADFVMMELGDNSTPSKVSSAGVNRHIASKVKGAMGPESDETQEARTA